MKIKICGLYRDEDIDAINSALPDWAGFVIDVPFSHRSVTALRAKQLISKLSTEVSPVGVFFDASPEQVADAAKLANLQAVQLHGAETNDNIKLIRQLLYDRDIDCQVWKAFKVKGDASIQAANASLADIVLLDGGVGEGRAFNWQLCTKMERPFIIAGGLTPQSISDALATGAMACDLSSGVETDKMKDPLKIEAAVAAARSIK